MMSKKFCTKLVLVPLIWYGIGRPDKEKIRTNFHDKGYQLSQRFKNYPVWDRYAEPFFISQFTNIFIAGHSFLEGMASDNENQSRIQKKLDEMDKNIKKEMDS
jgi:hypothetical protein